MCDFLRENYRPLEIFHLVENCTTSCDVCDTEMKLWWRKKMSLRGTNREKLALGV